MNEKQITIAVVDDEPEIIDLVQLVLGRRGYAVVGATGGQEGLECIIRCHPDLIFLDLMMPDMDGWEVYQQLKADDMTRNIAVIIVTAKAQGIDKVLGLHIAKVDDYITKPFGPSEILEVTARVLEERGYSLPSEKTNVLDQVDDRYTQLGIFFEKNPTEILPTLENKPITTWGSIITFNLYSSNIEQKGRALIALAAWHKNENAPFNSTEGQQRFWSFIRHSLASSSAKTAIERWGQLAFVGLSLMQPTAEISNSLCSNQWCKLKSS